MAVEDQVRELMQTVTPYPPVGLDGEAVTRSARRRHRRRITLLTLPAVVVAVALALGGTALLGRTDQPRSELPAGPATGWHRVPDMPLSPRYFPLVAWTGREALVIGGLDGTRVGPGHDGTPLQDGAAYDPQTRSWRAIAPAPEDLSGRTDDVTALADGTLLVAHLGDLLAYDIAGDSWQRLPPPPQEVLMPTIAAQDGRLYLLAVNDPGGADLPVQVLDLGTGSWSALPAGPGLPDGVLRTLVPTPAGLVVMGEGLDRASAALWDGSDWTDYPATDLRGSFWHWTGDRVISGWVTSDESDTRSAALDPASGTWDPLPWLPVDSPTTLWDAGRSPAAGSLVFSNSTVYDDATGTFTAVEPPEPELGRPGLAIGDRSLFAFGGYLTDPGHAYDRVKQVRTTSHAWQLEIPAEE